MTHLLPSSEERMEEHGDSILEQARSVMLEKGMPDAFSGLSADAPALKIVGRVVELIDREPTQAQFNAVIALSAIPGLQDARDYVRRFAYDETFAEKVRLMALQALATVEPSAATHLKRKETAKAAEIQASVASHPVVRGCCK